MVVGDGRLSWFGRSKWEGKRRRGDERRGEEGVSYIVGKVGVLGKTYGWK